MGYSTVNVLGSGSTEWPVSPGELWVARTYRYLHFCCVHAHADTRQRQKVQALLERMDQEAWVIFRTPEYRSPAIFVRVGDDPYQILLDEGLKTVRRVRPVVEVEASVSQGGDRA
jgi:hypothetical protein